MEQDLRADFYRSFKEQAKAIIKIDNECIKYKKEEILISLKDQAKANLRISSVTSGYKKGEFGIYSGFKVENGLIVTIINNSFCKTKFLSSRLAGDTSYTFIKRLNRNNYNILHDVNIDKECKNIVFDMQEYYIPVINSFVQEYKFAVENFEKLEYYKFISKNRFSVGVVLAILAKREDFINELIKMATISHPVQKYDRKEYFQDYNEANDPVKDIIDPIKKYITEMG
jgi:hypothetical protein